MPDLALPVWQELCGNHFHKLHLRPGFWPIPQAFVLHFLREPDGGDPHDHCFGMTTHILSGGYVEEVFTPDGTMTRVERLPGTAHRIEAEHIHRIAELPNGECITLALYDATAPVRMEQSWRWDADGALVRRWDSDEWRRPE